MSVVKISDTMEVSHLTSTKIPDLPVNKDIHVFVCYTSDNADQVRIIVRNLEECGMKCYYHDRDFTPGESIMGNTHDGMKRSVGMLIVLSEEFGNSRFCSFELDEALHMKISEKYLLVPVKLEPCEVPDCIRHISYIDAEDEPIDRVHLKIVKAFVDREIKKEQAARNGETVEYPLKPYKNHRMSMSRYQLKIDLQDRLKLNNRNFEISNELLIHAEQIVNKSGLVKYLHIYNSPCLIITIAVFLFLLIVMACFLVVLVTTSTDTPQSSITPAGAVLAVGLPLLFVLWIVSSCVLTTDVCKRKHKQQGFPNNYVKNFIIQERRRLNNKLWDAVTMDPKNKQRLFVFLHNASLVVMWFNLNPCKDFFIRKLDRKEHLRKYINRGESPEDYTDRIFKVFLRNRIHMLNVPVTDASVIRQSHRVSTGAKCVCLLAEEWICGQ